MGVLKQEALQFDSILLSLYRKKFQYFDNNEAYESMSDTDQEVLCAMNELVRLGCINAEAKEEALIMVFDLLENGLTG
jgi:hypothetical protein